MTALLDALHHPAAAVKRVCHPGQAASSQAVRPSCARMSGSRLERKLAKIPPGGLLQTMTVKHVKYTLLLLDVKDLDVIVDLLDYFGLDWHRSSQLDSVRQPTARQPSGWISVRRWTPAGYNCMVTVTHECTTVPIRRDHRVTIRLEPLPSEVAV